MGHEKPGPASCIRSPPLKDAKTPKDNLWLMPESPSALLGNALFLPPLQWGSVVPAFPLIIPYVSRSSLCSLLRGKSESAPAGSPSKEGIRGIARLTSFRYNVGKAPNEAALSGEKRRPKHCERKGATAIGDIPNEDKVHCFAC